MEREFPYLSFDDSKMKSLGKSFRECFYRDYKLRHEKFTEEEPGSQQKQFPQMEVVSTWPHTKQASIEEKNHEKCAIPMPKIVKRQEKAELVCQPAHRAPEQVGLRKRANFTQQQRELLDNYFWAHKDHPYVDRHTLEILHQQTGLSRHQIRVFFTNARMRRYKALKPE